MVEQSAGQLTRAIEALLNEREELLDEQEISVEHVWVVPIVINSSIGFEVEIDEKMLSSFWMKYERDLIVKDLVCYVYQKVEEMLLLEDQDEQIIQ